MTLRQRMSVLSLLAASALGAYAAAKAHSAALEAYVVEQMLIQKSPTGADPVFIHKRLQTLLASVPKPEDRMAKLLLLSQHLERVQLLTQAELEKLLGKEESGPKDGKF